MNPIVFSAAAIDTNFIILIAAVVIVFIGLLIRYVINGVLDKTFHSIEKAVTSRNSVPNSPEEQRLADRYAGIWAPPGIQPAVSAPQPAAYAQQPQAVPQPAPANRTAAPQPAPYAQQPAAVPQPAPYAQPAPQYNPQASAAQPAPRPRFCSGCGSPFHEGSRFCARCGKPL